MKEIATKVFALIETCVAWGFDTKVSVFGAIAAAAMIGAAAIMTYILVTDYPVYYWVRNGVQYAFCLRAGVVIMDDEEEDEVNAGSDN